MELFQVLSCNNALGNCCTDYGLVGILNISRRILELIQFIVPIVLIVAGTIQFIQLSINPDLKDGFRKILNKLIAALFIFLLPTLVDVILGVASSDFSLATCWEQAKTISTETVFSGGNYTITDSDINPVWANVEMIDMNKISNYGASKNGTAKQQKIVEYASQFIGEKYVWGGEWNGELPYTPTDCSGFVTGVFKHFGINLPKGKNMFGYDTSLYTVVSESEMQPGDVIMYDGHVGIYTGKGREIIHAKGSNWGVVKDSDYRRCSSHKILGFLRIKGV